METFGTKAYGATGSLIGGKTLAPMNVERETERSEELLIEVLYCGVCHSDIHQVANDWKNTIYPCVPGHEIVGKVIRAGAATTKFKTGDIVGVGCMIDSCKECVPCREGQEQFCQGPFAMTMTYNGHFKPDSSEFNTFGGYSTHIVANERFVLKIPENLDLKAVAPILCAGVTTYSPLKYANITSGKKVGVIGIGGLGHMAVKIARAMGSSVTAITSKEEKKAAAIALGADEVLISDDAKAMQDSEVKFDFILCTIPYSFDINLYIPLLKYRGALVTVGLLGPYKSATNNMEVAKLTRTVGGSMIGSVAETQEALDFCSQHSILPDVKIIRMNEINDAFEKVKNEEVRFRYVIDMSSLK